MAEDSKFESPFEDPFENQVVADPFIDDHFGSNPGMKADAGSGTSQGNWSDALPDSTAVLVLGILSIIGSFCYGIVGLILGIIALAMASRPERLYKQNPDKYSPSSISNLKAGKVCGIIGTALSGVIILIMLIVFAAAFS
jgi:M penetrans paralogue family 26